jgi:ATP-dependent RNA helicase DeaD
MISESQNTIGFDSFNLPQHINQALVRMGYTTPTSIQAQAIPFALQGRDILGSAQTGTGKTAAFSIPMIVKLMENPQSMALVLAPTRELASQTLEVVHKLTSNNRDIRTALLIGGEPMGKQFDQLRQNPRLIVGTPGRINDHLRRNPKLLSRVNFIAVDEADRMLDMGFSEQIDEIFAMVPKERQMLMFSATFPESIIKFSRNYLNNPERVSVSNEKINTPKINHVVIRTTDGEKYNDLVEQLNQREGSVLIFVKTQHGTERLAKRLDGNDHPSVVIHGGLRQNQREKAVRTFRQQRARILVATDVAARGLDIPHIEHVINYDLPQVAEDYIHRIGRTGRAGAEGEAMCFVVPSETGKWNAINRILNPGEAPIRKERGGEGSGDRRPNRGRPSFGGLKGNDFKKREDRPFNRDRDGERSFTKRPPQKKEWGNDRPSSSATEPRRGYAEQGGSRSDGNRNRDDRNWNQKEGRSPYKPAAERGEGNRSFSKAPYKKDDRAPFKRNDSSAPRGASFSRDDRDGNRGGNFSKPTFRQRDDNRGNDRPAPRRDDRDGNKRSEGTGHSNGDRNFSRPASYQRDDSRGNGRSSAPRRDRDTAPVKSTGSKPKSSKPLDKKPFKFKEHSRKTLRAPKSAQAV